MRPADLPDERPADLALVATAGPWFRFDRQPAGSWDWNPFPTPRHRFDSISGNHRLRYASTTFTGAARERFDAADRIIGRSDHDHWLVELTGTLQVVDLRGDDTLDVLGLDDRINTGRLTADRAVGDDALDTAGTLTDRLMSWFATGVHGIVYRSRTTPQRAANLAFFAHAPYTVTSSRKIRDLDDSELATLVIEHGFHIEGRLGAP